MSIIDQTTPSPDPAPGSGAVTTPVDPPVRIDGEQADRLLRCTRWQQ